MKDVIISGDTISKIDDLILSLHRGDVFFVLLMKVVLTSTLELISRTYLGDNSFEMTHPSLIERITSLLGIYNGRAH